MQGRFSYVSYTSFINLPEIEGKSPWHLFEILSLVWQALYVITKTGKDSIHVLTQISEQQNIQRTISDTLEFEISIMCNFNL